MMKLKSGSYYKTRDGRKVGPMVIQDDETFPFLDDTQCESYRPDGTWSFRTDEVHRNDLVAEWVDEPMVEHKFKVGDAVKHKKLGYVGTINDVLGGGRYRTYWPCQGWGGNDEGRDLEPAAVAPATATPEIEIEVALEPTPTIGDAVLIPGWIAGITNSARGTNYNIVFETQNRRVSLHFLEEDFIIDDDEVGCPCANDNDPVRTGDTAKAFDALANSLFGLTVRRAA